MAEEFETDSSVRGYHVYQGNWIPIIGEQLNCEREHMKKFRPKTKLFVAAARNK